MLLIIILPAYGQKMVNSPYSRFNLGLLEPAYNFRSAAMGGVSVPLRDNTTIAFANPASYSSVDTNSFIFDFGIDYTAAILKDNTNQHFSDDFNFDHLIIGFPIKKNWGFAAGLVPYSNGYYYIAKTIVEGDPMYHPIAGDVTIAHKGTGGISKAFFGTGVQIRPNLSVGLNMNILFGEINRINENFFEDDITLFNSRFEENLAIHGVSFGTGLQYTLKLKEKKSITTGLAYSFGSNYGSDYSNIFLRFNNFPLQPYSPDTITITDVVDGTVFIPGTFTSGLSFNIENKLTAAFEYSSSPWNNADIYGSGGQLAPTHSFRAGIEYIPERFSIYNVLNRLEYRLGGHITDNYLLINGEQVKEFGITFGIGIPMPRSWSKINIFFDYNSRGGSLSNGLHRENCYSFGISLNLYDYWFIKAKYD